MIFTVSLIVVVHILHNKIRCAEVNEPSTRISVFEERCEQLNKLFFTIVIKDKVLLLFDNRIPLVECRISVLISHVSFEFREITARDIDHVVFVDSWLICVFIITARHSTCPRCTWSAFLFIIAVRFTCTTRVLESSCLL